MIYDDFVNATEELKIKIVNRSGTLQMSRILFFGAAIHDIRRVRVYCMTAEHSIISAVQL